MDLGYEPYQGYRKLPDGTLKKISDISSLPSYLS